MSSYRQGIATAVEYGALPEIDENATTLVVETLFTRAKGS